MVTRKKIAPGWCECIADGCRNRVAVNAGSDYCAECAHGDHCERPEKVTCYGCGRSWCERCDPAPSALCHYCHGRGYSTAPMSDD